MDIKTLKFTEDMFVGKDISSMPDNPSESGVSASELKDWFDAVPKMMVALGGFNALIDALTSAEAGAAGGQNIGISVPDIAAQNVNEGMAELRATTYTKSEVDSAAALKADKADTYNKNDLYTKPEVDAKTAEKADKTSVLTTDNTNPFTPTADYQPATKLYVDMGGEGGNVTKLYVDEQDEKLKQTKADKPTIATATLTAALWEGGAAPYEQTVDVAGVLESGTDQFVDVADDVTLPQLEAFGAAQIAGYTQAEGAVTLRAWGNKPTIDIPLKVQVVML